MRSMRIRMFLSLWLVLALAVATAGLAQAQTVSHLDQIGQRGVLRVGTTGDFKPFSFLNPATNEYEGHDIDAAKLLAESLGVKAQFVKTTWPTLLKGLQDGINNVSRWGITQGQGALVGASYGELPVATAVSDAANGGVDAKTAIKKAAAALVSIQASLK